ncbi:MAG: hypothetical protein LC099_11925 [Anaerolineales bacterium]|nr:hypothetical protein [Anaerolineales bacterium]
MVAVNRSIDDLGLSPRAANALKTAGILNIGQFVEKYAEGEAALLDIKGFTQSALTAAKKKLRALEVTLPEPVKVEKAESAEASESETPAETAE